MRILFYGGPWHDRELVLPDLRTWRVEHETGNYLYAYRGLRQDDNWIYELGEADRARWAARRSVE